MALISSKLRDVFNAHFANSKCLAICRSVDKELSPPKLSSLLRRFLPEIEEVIREAVKEEVSAALNDPNLEETFGWYMVAFAFRIMSPLVRSSLHVLRGLETVENEDVEELVREEETMYKRLAEEIRATGYKHAEELVYGLSVIADHDVWVLRKVKKYGIEGLLRRLGERALMETVEASRCLAALLFTWFSATAALFNLVDKFREENRDTLAKWSKELAEELDAYIDTLDLLISDEDYEALKEVGLVS